MKKLKLISISLIIIIALTALFACNNAGGNNVGDQSGTDGEKIVQNINVDMNVVDVMESPGVPTTNTNLKEVLKNVRPSVVEVYATSTNQSLTSQNEGSGVVIACAKIEEEISEGQGISVTPAAPVSEYVSYIATCYHIVEKSTAITVIDIDGNEYMAKPVGADDRTDICILAISAEMNPVTFRVSSGIEVGEDVVAIGNPLGTIGGTVTKGIIGAVNRDIIVEGNKIDLFQTDAAINSGNSGGGLFTTDGFFIGLVNAKYLNSYDTSFDGLAFVTPSDTVRDISEKLIETYDGTSLGYIPGRYYFGCTVINRYSSPWGTSSYVSINTIDPAGSFYKGGLQEGDRIVSVTYKGQEGTVSDLLDVTINISTTAQFTEALDSFDIEVGDHIIFDVRRGQYSGFLDIEILQYVVGAE